MKTSTCVVCGKVYELKPRASIARAKSCMSCRKIYHEIISKRWRNNNKERFEEYRRTWVKNNPDKVRENMKKYREQNLELCRKRTRDNQVKLNDKKRFGGNRLKILGRDRYICQSCGKDVSAKYHAVVHHLNKNKKDNRLDNLITACRNCHAYNHFLGGDYKIRGWYGKRVYKVTCRHCGEIFETYWWDAYKKHGTGRKFCSRECSSKHGRKPQSIA